MVSINNLNVSFGSFDLLSDVSFMVNKKDRIGLVGKNGAGKSTLLKIISGLQSPTSGTISSPSDVSIGYLPQQMKIEDSGVSVVDEAKKTFKEYFTIQEEIDSISDKIVRPEDYSESDYLKLVERLSFLSERLGVLGLDNIDSEVEKILKGLGFKDEDLKRKVTEFSGGWRMRIELAKILLRNPDVILLDEPTNHLDIEAIQWVEEFLNTYRGAVLTISHDRAFLDNVTNRTIEINLGRIYDYKVSYSKFKVLQQERIKQELAAYENQQKAIGETEKFIEKFRYKATKANQVQSRIKQLDKLERLEVDTLDASKIKMKFPPAPRSGDIVVETDGFSKSYGEKEILKNIDFVVERGEKIAFVGRNGEGKTTFSKAIMGEIEYFGKLKLGHNVRIGYFAQNQDELLNPELTVFETLDRIAVGDIRTKIRDILGAFLFSGEDIDKKVKVLSGGEQSRLSLAILLLEPHNLLVLDEPTNHLDIKSKDMLKMALQNFDGTLIIVSHDRYFLDGLVDKVYEFRDKKVKQHIGGIYDFLQARKLETMREIEKSDKSKQTEEKEKNTDNKAQYLERKESEKKRRNLKNKITRFEKEIETLENEIQVINQSLENPSNIKADDLEQLYKKFDKLNIELVERMKSWESALTEFDQFENNPD